jgi:hypothetical protein
LWPSILLVEVGSESESALELVSGLALALALGSVLVL